MVLFPTTPLLDNFNRADNAGPPSASWSSPAFQGDTNLKISGNKVMGTGAFGDAYWNATTFADGEVYATLAALPPSTTQGYYLSWRFINHNSAGERGYYAYFMRDGTFGYIRRWDGPGSSVLLVNFVLPGALSVGDKIGVRMIGTAITVFCYTAARWQVVATASDSTYTSPGTIGLVLEEATTSAFDDFGGGPYGGSLGGPPASARRPAAFAPGLAR